MITVGYKIFLYQLSYIRRPVIPRSPGNQYYHRKSFFEQHGGHQYDVVFVGGITDSAEWEDLFPSLKPQIEAYLEIQRSAPQ